MKACCVTSSTEDVALFVGQQRLQLGHQSVDVLAAPLSDFTDQDAQQNGAPFDRDGRVLVGGQRLGELAESGRPTGDRAPPD